MNIEQLGNKELLVGKFDVVIALGKNWRLPIEKNSRIHLSLESKMTTIAAGELYIQGKVNKIIFSTGKTAGKDSEGIDFLSEAEEMKSYLRNYFSIDQIPDEDIILEINSFDTAGNAEEVKKILETEKMERSLLLTVETHLERSQELFENHGVLISNSLSSESVLRQRSKWHELLVEKYHSSKKHRQEKFKEKLGQLLVATIDSKGKWLRSLTTLTRHRTKG